MSISLLRQAVRAPLPALAGGLRFWRAHGARVRRARVLSQCADGLRLRRAPAWEERSARLYRRATRTLRGLSSSPSTSTSPDVAPADALGDPAARAHRALAAAQAPYRRGAIGLATAAIALGVVALLLALLASAVSPAARARFFPRDLARGRPWNASSADPGYDTRGVGPSTRRSHFFHTTFSDHPSLEIDLGEEHVIRSVSIKNRSDCCQERAMPLNVEIFDGQRWQLIAQRRSPFSEWEHDVTPVRARLVRVRLAGFGFLHLKRVSIYGE